MTHPAGKPSPSSNHSSTSSSGPSLASDLKAFFRTESNWRPLLFALAFAVEYWVRPRDSWMGAMRWVFALMFLMLLYWELKALRKVWQRRGLAAGSK